MNLKMSKINQVIIFAGGLGTRLHPLTKECPKPLININGKPFIFYIIDRLINQKIKEIILLTGYRFEDFNFIFDCYKNIDIKIINTPLEYQTSLRILDIRNLLDDYFYIFYGDNFWPFNLQELEKSFFRSKTDAQIVIYKNDDKYSISNIEIDDNNFVIKYDKYREGLSCNYVDIGFGIFQKKHILLLDHNENVGFEKIIYDKLLINRQIKSYVTLHRYYTLTNLKRLPSLQRILSNQKYVFLDRDGIINIKPPAGKYLKHISDFKWRDNILELFKFFRQKDIRVIVLTNQAGISKGDISYAELDMIHNHIQSELFKINCKIEIFFCCPHHWDENCFCRKPNPGLLYQAQKLFDINLTDSYFFGDSESDVLAASNASAKGILIHNEENIYETIKKYYR